MTTMRTVRGTRRWPGRAGAALLTGALVLVLAACAPGSGSSSPSSVVQDALGKIAAKDVDGLRGLACAGQEDTIRNQLGLAGAIGSELLPGLDTQALLDAVQVDVSKIKVGDAVITGETANVPLTGDLGVSFDAATLRPILKQVLEQQGMTMTDAQVDALLSGLATFAQAVPVNQSVRLVQESGAWKICQETVPTP
jgi:hypothetical protein